MSPPHHVLLLGGSGKIARLLTPMLLRRSWAVTSIIRDPAQVGSLQKLGEGEGIDGKLLNVRVWSIEEVKSDEKAKELIDEVKPDYVVFSAGAGGKGPPERVRFLFSFSFSFSFFALPPFFISGTPGYLSYLGK
jgi:nucleoside-diphosphate-sugar epimerase